MSKCHVFSIEDAVKYGVEKAVIIQNIRFWLEKVAANDKDSHKHDGYYWTYNSARAFADIFPYFNKSKVHRLLTQLEDDGIIMSGNFNKAKYDRTKWYSMPEFSIFDNSNNQVAEVKNGSVESATPIPDVITNVIPDVISNTKDIVSEVKNEADSLVEFWNDNRPPQSAVKVKVWSKKVKTRLKTFTADEIKQAMIFVINDNWYQSNSQVLIKNVIDSDDRCAAVLEKSNQPTNTTKGLSHDSQQPKQSQARSFDDNLDAQLAADEGWSNEYTVN